MSQAIRSFCTFIVEDPSNLIKGYPKTTHEIYVVLNRDFNELNNDKSAPSSVNFDNAIIEMTLDKEKGRELRGSMGGFTEYNCAHCGGGLLLRSCSSCGHEFNDDHYRSGWYTPLSPKMVAFLEQQGHKFAVSPEIAQKNEMVQLAERLAREGVRLSERGKTPEDGQFDFKSFIQTDWKAMRDDLIARGERNETLIAQ